MSLLDDLKELDVNTDEGLGRFMNNAALYEKMIKKFNATVADLEVMPHFESGDLDKALTNAHTLKGVTGNLSLTPLYTAYTEIVTQLRANNPEQAKEKLAEILPIQKKIIECIEKYAQ
ncbi:MAG: hypothetical protein HDR10_10710 [Lachnospiraceae bacterium]|nr:hypothetical protein [Lachnospiraceae bacterium]